jgi:hypothetical protein
MGPNSPGPDAIKPLFDVLQSRSVGAVVDFRILGITWGRIFVHFFRGKFRGKFSPKNVGRKLNFPRKKFRKIIFPRNSAEFSAESDFPQKKMYKKSAPECDYVFLWDFKLLNVNIFVNNRQILFGSPFWFRNEG